MSLTTTPSWQRPFWVERPVSGGWNDLNIVDLLAETGMAKSKAEAGRMIEQDIIWLDNGVTELEVSTIWDRFMKAKPHENKYLLIERGDTLGVGRTVDDAICHRIEFV